MKKTFQILGSGAGPGAPSFFCDCLGCQEAHHNPAFARTRSSACIMTDDCTILLDTPPDLRVQLLREKITRIDAILLTHWHYDHFGGLGELEYYVKLRRKEPLPLYLPPSAIGQCEKAFPNLAEVFAIRAWEFGKVCSFGAISITPLPANHGIETAGFFVKSDLKRLAYFPDTAGLPNETAQQVKGVDYFICDATFHGDNWFPECHMNVEEAIALGRKIQADHTILTHLSIHYSQPVTVKELTEITSPYRGVLAASDGMLIDL